MITRNTYLKKPCTASSIPYWKAKNITIPASMKILHEKDFSADLLKDYNDEPYFRLFHSMKRVKEVKLPGYELVTASAADIDTIVTVINKSYEDLQVSVEQIQSYTKTPVYCPELWLMVKETGAGTCVGCGIADFDAETKELILEWIQVLPEYRGLNIGTAIVSELLWRGKEFADFATVSGKVENETKPEALYRKCGFSGNDVWHVLHKKK